MFIRAVIAQDIKRKRVFIYILFIMDSGENKIKSSYNPRKSANIFSILFF